MMTRKRANRMDNHDDTALLRRILAELRLLDTQRAVLKRLVRVLKAGRRAKVVLVTPQRQTARAPKQGRRLDSKLYDRTLGIIRASERPMTMTAVRVALRAQGYRSTSVYYHLTRAEKRGEVIRDDAGRYLRVPASRPDVTNSDSDHRFTKTA